MFLFPPELLPEECPVPRVLFHLSAARQTVVAFSGLFLLLGLNILVLTGRSTSPAPELSEELPVSAAAGSQAATETPTAPDANPGQQIRQHEMQIRVVGRQRCRFGKTIYGLIDAALKVEQIAEVSMGIGKFGVDGDGVSVGGFGLFEPALCPVNVAYVRARGASRRVEARRLLQVLEGSFQAAALAKHAAEQIMRVRVIRGQIEHFTVGALGQWQVAGLMMLQTLPYSIDNVGVLIRGCAVSRTIGEYSIEKAHDRLRASPAASTGPASPAASPMQTHLPRTLKISPLVASSMKSCR